MTSPAALLPHAGPAVMLETVLRHAPGGIVCSARVPAAHALVRAGRAPAFVSLELAAQAAALLEALNAGAAGAPARARRGWLVSARDVVFETGEISAGERLEVAVEPAGRAGGLSLYRLAVRSAAGDCAHGTIGTFVEPEPAEEAAR